MSNTNRPNQLFQAETHGDGLTYNGEPAEFHKAVWIIRRRNYESPTERLNDYEQGLFDQQEFEMLQTIVRTAVGWPVTAVPIETRPVPAEQAPTRFMEYPSALGLADPTQVPMFLTDGFTEQTDISGFFYMVQAIYLPPPDQLGEPSPRLKSRHGWYHGPNRGR